MINLLQEKYQFSLMWLLSAVATLGILPFTIIRYLDGNYSAAIIDMTLIVVMIILVTYATFSKKVRAVSAVLAVFINAGALVITLDHGIDSFLWVYPVSASTFILVKPIEAFGINIIAGLCLVAFSDIFNTVSLDAYLVTMLMLSMSTFVYASHGVKQFRLLERLNTVDPLTGAFNRRALSLDMENSLSNCGEERAKPWLVILDLDYFKKINDNYGHGVGDQILQQFVIVNQLHLGQLGRLYRFGGEEFVLLLPNLNEQHESVLNGLREVIKKELKTPDGEAITVSFGAALCKPNTTADKWLKRADDALYLAKQNGRDCVVFAKE